MSGGNKLVCLSPGHNVKNLSNRSPDGTYYEHEFAFDVCDKARGMIKRIPGLDCFLTREYDTYPTSLEDKVKMAIDRKADLYLSQHSNAYGSGGWQTPNGFGVYIYPGRQDSLSLAEIALRHSLDLLPMNSRGIRERDLYEVRVPPMPAVLFETGFHTNQEDVAKLKTQEFRLLQAKVLTLTACEYLEVKYIEEDSIMSAKQHIVVSGDRMSRIAADNNLTIQQIADFNPHIPNPSEIFAEYGGDIVFLEEPNGFEIEFATMKREYILTKMDLTSQNDVLKAHLAEEKKKNAAAESRANKYQDAGRQINRLSSAFLD